MEQKPFDRGEAIFVEDKQAGYPIDTSAIKKAVALVLDEEGAGSVEVAITFVNSKEMAGLNKHYRNIDGPTDVLSFSMTENAEGHAELNFPNPEEVLGDIVVCPAVAAENAVTEKHSADREILEITIHGLLHLLGYEHQSAEDEERMLARQVELASMCDET